MPWPTLHIYVEARSTPDILDRLHQYARCIDGLILPDAGKSRWRCPCMTRVNHADSAKSSQKITFTWVQIARLQTVSILYQLSMTYAKNARQLPPSSRAEAVAGPRQGFALAEFLPQRCFLLRPHVRSEGSARRPQGWRFV
jgi:hypothetical protein